MKHESIPEETITKISEEFPERSPREIIETNPCGMIRETVGKNSEEIPE